MLEVPSITQENERAPDSGPVLIGTSAASLGAAAAGASASTDPAPASIPFDTAHLPNCGEKVGGRCVLRALLGEGAFGRVFAAEDEETGQQVALKAVGLRRYPREYAEHELRALAAIAHPNVVQLNEHGVEAGAAEPYSLVHDAALPRAGLGRVAEGPRPAVARARARGVYAHRRGRVRCIDSACGIRTSSPTISIWQPWQA